MESIFLQNLPALNALTGFWAFQSSVAISAVAVNFTLYSPNIVDYFIGLEDGRHVLNCYYFSTYFSVIHMDDGRL